MKAEFVFVLLLAYVLAFAVAALMVLFDLGARSIGDLDLPPALEVIE